MTLQCNSSKGCAEQVPEAALPVDGDQVNHSFVISADVLFPFLERIIKENDFCWIVPLH